MESGNIAPREMARTFNNGVGMVLVVGQSHVDDVLRVLHESGEPVVHRMGEVTNGQGVELRGLDTWASH